MASLAMNKLPWWGQLLVFVFVGGAVVGGYFYMWEWPQQEQLDIRRAELAAIRGRIEKGMETARQLPEFRAQVGDLESKLEGLKAILPEEKDVADLLRRIQTLASQSNLTIRHFRPRAITAKEMYAEWPIEIEVEGAYHNVGLFLDRVAKLPRIINVGSIDMVTAPPRPGSSATVKVTCTAMTFVLKEQPTGASAPTVPAKKTE
ncbi:MAG: type 4a pilus biogenesis protein PilO [Acidobacteriota bacterium]